MAETLGKTVSELLMGQPQPLRPLETKLWGYFRRAQARLEQQRKQGLG